MPESAPSSPVTACPESVSPSAAPASVPALSRAEVRELLFDLPWPELQALAHQCRLRHKGRHVHVRGLLEFSNVCRRNCRYCGLRHENRRLSRYSLSAAELLRAASQAVAAGVDTLVLQSGEMARNPLWLAQVVRGLKERFGLPVTLSVGEQPREWYALWREAGATRPPMPVSMPPCIPAIVWPTGCGPSPGWRSWAMRWAPASWSVCPASVPKVWWTTSCW